MAHMFEGYPKQQMKEDIKKEMAFVGLNGIPSDLKQFLKEVKAGQSLNLATWADAILKSKKISYEDIEKAFRLGF